MSSRAWPGQLRETRLLEYARIDFLSPAERAIYLRNRVYDPDDDMEVGKMSTA